jgi:ABC-type nitrate/sulfonate/bicarbonate transport system permease component
MNSVKATLQKIFEPFKTINNKTYAILIVVQLAFALLVWQLSGGGLIPTPDKIFASVVSILGSVEFIDNFFASLALMLEGMGISIVLALIVAYLSIIPFFRPFANFVVKCRYLTLTGLIFLFTLLTKDGHSLKISLLVFGIVPFFVTSLLSEFASISVQEYELCRTLRMNTWQTLYEVVIVGRLDKVLDVLRQNFAISWMMITMVEGLNMSEGGLGTMLIKSNKYIDLGKVFGILVIIFLLGMLFDYVLGWLRSIIFPYTKLQKIDK